MMKAKTIVTAMLSLLGILTVAVPAYSQDAAPRPMSQFMHVGTGGQKATATYQCLVTTKNAGVEKTIIRAASEDSAKRAAVQKLGSRSTGLAGVSCARTTGSAMPPADVSGQKPGVKTRSPTPPLFEAVSPAVVFAADGSCTLSQEAIGARPDARDHCQAHPAAKGGSFVCTAKYCATLK